jgi:SNF family Na+-dependent transporter
LDFLFCKGIGFANLIIVFLGNVYYEVILAWTMRYLFDSFSFEVPWKSCNKTWNTKCCSESLLYSNSSNFVNTNVTSLNVSSNSLSCKSLVDPITEYWEYVFFCFCFVLPIFTLAKKRT